MPGNSHSWKTEIRQLISRPGFQKDTRRAVLIHLAVLAAFGVAIPHQKGQDFPDAVVLGTCLCLSVVFAAPAGAGPLEELAQSFGAALVRLGRSILYGAAISLDMLATGLAVVRSTFLLHRALSGKTTVSASR
jgi:hypothetical protein